MDETLQFLCLIIFVPCHPIQHIWNSRDSFRFPPLWGLQSDIPLPLIKFLIFLWLHILLFIFHALPSVTVQQSVTHSTEGPAWLMRCRDSLGPPAAPSGVCIVQEQWGDPVHWHCITKHCVPFSVNLADWRTTARTHRLLCCQIHLKYFPFALNSLLKW